MRPSRHTVMIQGSTNEIVPIKPADKKKAIKNIDPKNSGIYKELCLNDYNNVDFMRKTPLH